MAEEYAGELTKLAVSKASIAMGYKYANLEVVDCLADVIRHYIETLAEEGQSSIESYGRTNPGVMDFFPIVEQPKLKCTATSWRDLQTFALDQPSKIGVVSSGNTPVPSTVNKAKWNQPFPIVTPFPIKRTAPVQVDNNAIFGNQSNDEDVVANLPSYLPPYPPPHTYKRTKKRANETEKKMSIKKSKPDPVNTATSISSTSMTSAASRDVQHALSVLEAT